MISPAAVYVISIAGMLLWGIVGFKFATHSRFKRNNLVRFVVEEAVATSKKAHHRPPDALDVLRLIDGVGAVPERDIWFSHVARLRFEWSPNDPPD